MNKYLQSADRFKEVARLENGKLHFLLKESVNDFEARSICGRYSIVDGCALMLYRNDSSIIVGAGNQSVVLNDGVSARLKKGLLSNRLVLLKGGEELLSLKYKPKVKTPAERVDPTPFVEEEDRDFCLFVCNVVNDHARQSRIFKNQP